MGIYLKLSISKSVTREEWSAVYGESLTLVDAFRLGEKRDVNVRGVDVRCLVPTVERTQKYGWRDELEVTGWEAHGDMKSLRTAEWFFTRKELPHERYDPDDGDPIVSALDPYGREIDGAGCDDPFCMWGMKTQGEPYHIYLLAIACLIQDRLGDKAFVTGDITRGQCVEATRLANEHLAVPIEIPDQCDFERLVKRASNLPLSRLGQIAVVFLGYLGPQNAEFGERLRGAFAEEDLDDYWQNRFDDLRIGSYAYSSAFRSCLELGFSFEDLVSWTNFDLGCDGNTGSEAGHDSDDGNQYLDFIDEVIGAQLHVAEKDCSDVLVTDPDDSGLHGVATQFAEVIIGGFFGLRNKRVNRFIPIETIRRVLKDAIGDRVDVDSVIDERLAAERRDVTRPMNVDGADEADESRELFSSDEFNNMVNDAVNLMRERAEQYDISRFAELPYYRQGDSVAPHIAKSLESLRSFMSVVVEEQDCQELIGGSWKARCECLAANDAYLLLSVSDWEKIFDEIKVSDESFARYYFAVRIELVNEDIRDMVTAFARNDDLYEYVMGT